MRERHELPHPRYTGRDKDGGFTYRPQFLPDFVTVRFSKDGTSFEAEVNPNKVKRFRKEQEKMLGGLDSFDIL